MTIISEVARKYARVEAEVLQRVENARRSMVPRSKRVVVIEQGIEHTLKVTREGVGPLNTQFGVFYHFSFYVDDKWTKYSVLVMAELSSDFYPKFKDGRDLLLRIDSGCETGQLFGDRTCECREQLELCLKKIAEKGEGIVVNIPRQDGRGLGLPFKLATLVLQGELGVHTIEASALLDPDGSRDVRTYAGVIGILKFLGIPGETRIHLASNNPKKSLVFAENGYQLCELEPMVVPPTEYTFPHLRAKQELFGHVDLVPESTVEQKGVFTSKWAEELRLVMEKKDTAVCCGLDPDLHRMPRVFQDTTSPELAIFDFLARVVDISINHVCAYKIQKAFFDLHADGHRLLARLISHIRTRDPETKVIIDCKIGDTDNTMRVYLEAIFSKFSADAVVLNPYMGSEVWDSLKSYPDKAGLLLIRTSNPGSSVIQDIPLQGGQPLWQRILAVLLREWEKGLTLIPILSEASGTDVSKVRKLLPDSMPVFLAGVGAQGGSIECVKALKDSRGAGVIVNSSRALLYPYAPEDENWAKAIEDSVEQMRTRINELRR